jgi:hypothetical protein
MTQHGACASHAGWLSLPSHNQDIKYLLIYQRNRGYANMSQCYVTCHVVSCNSLTHTLGVLYRRISYRTSEVVTTVNIDYKLLDMTPYNLVDKLYLLRRSSNKGLHMYTNPRVTRGVYRSPTRCTGFASGKGHGKKSIGYPLHIFLELLRSLSSVASYISLHTPMHPVKTNTGDKIR